MQAFYVIKSPLFNDTDLNTQTQQLAFPKVKNNSPCIYFSKNDMQPIKNITKYKLNCETLVNKCGRAYYTEEIFTQFILIEDTCFYYNKDLTLLLFSCNKDTFNTYVKKYSTDANIRLEKILVDFERIIRDQKQLGIKGAWLGKIPDDNLNALAFLGDNVVTSEQYKSIRSNGAEISNLTLIYDYTGEQKTIMITKDGGIILYHHEDETDAINLVQDIYMNLLA
ncbi:hypothetical protein FDF26_12725 [Clostridium botulinum]|uniref:hypothetical protein n=1 Tax=Clostridium botulinum TaxID=1491 RepID=UPI0005975B58|nr:hypothetical protein [Clostridium botulinum]KIL06620.1 hypothetical protein SR42_15885 [Clostridium botulinum]MBY6934546.1 hypothetical protein [Clostridium botulinum]NFL83520.1 hypothetical protein [Clostridium botulinum]NFN11853.1 hypothetical protein [Clostridium botulinum]NFO36378.1 hypothetical protein [Clostridium botulinum]